MVRREGRTASWHLADIARSADVNRMVDEFIARHGRIDILVNNAVASIKKPFLEIEEADWDFEVGNALKGYFLCSQRAAREMVAPGRRRPDRQHQQRARIPGMAQRRRLRDV